jgi:hypothetical protein
VQALLSFGRSALLTLVVVPPAPLQTAVRQSPAVCAANGVFTAVRLTPQTPAVHVRVEHSVSLPAQSEAAKHSTHAPAPLHSEPPLSEQAVPALSGGFDAVPAVQTSWVQLLLSTGRSELLATLTSCPAPSHWNAWQSPTGAVAVSVPEATGVSSHRLLVHVAVRHGLSGKGQSIARAHSAPPSPASEAASPASLTLPLSMAFPLSLK